MDSPSEWLGSPQAAQYPLHMLSPHPIDRLHSQLDQTRLRREYAVAGREPIWISPTLLRVSAMAEDLPQIVEIDCNPVIVQAERAAVVDVRIRVDATEPASLLKRRV